MIKLDGDNLEVNFIPHSNLKKWNIIYPCFEQQYVNSLLQLKDKGVLSENRTGINTLSLKHQYFQVNNIEYHFPVIRGKKVYPKLALTELIWMLKGRTDVKWLQDNGVKYWNEWTKEDGTIGPSYGKQFRDFNGVDQLQLLVDGMCNDLFGRRHILNLWNVNDLQDMSLPPCFYDFHFTVTKINETGYIDLHVRSRSEDSFLGMPYDIMFVSWFLLFITDYIRTKTNKNLVARTIHYTADDYHLYVNHTEPLQEYLDNIESNKDKFYDKPLNGCLESFYNFIDEKITIDEYIDLWYNNIDDIIDFMGVKNYYSCKPIKAEVAV